MITRAALTALPRLLPMLLALAAGTGCTSAPSIPGDEEGEEGPGGNAAPGAPAQNGGTGGATGIDPNDPSVVDLGEVQAGAEVTFDVPQGTLGFTIVVDGTVTANDALGVQDLGDPSGAAVIQDYVDVKEPGRATRGDLGSGVGVVGIPQVGNHATEAVPAGKWKVKIGGVTGSAKGGKGSATPFAGKTHAAVRFQTSSDGTFKGGALDLDLYVPDGLMVGDTGAPHVINAAGAATDAALQSRLTVAFGMFKRLYNLDRGDVRYHALPAAIAELGSQEQIDAANRLATFVGPRASAQIILVNRLRPDGDDGGEISGVSNCLPGAVGLPGTRCSAVVVSLRSETPAWQDAATLVHELGHFVGLEHTTEFDGYADTLSDTPACTALGKSQLASCPDHDNLMFPTVNLATDEPSVAVSATQRALVQASPLYRATR